MQKTFHFILLILLGILSNCNPPTPPIIPTSTDYCLIKKSVVNGTDSVNLVLDSQKRVLSYCYYSYSSVEKYTSHYSYSPNQIQRIDSNGNVLMSKIRYNLDASGKVIKSINQHYGAIPFNPNPGAIDTTYYYYDANNFLVKKLVVWEHHNAPTPYNAYDTITYIIDNENVVGYARRSKGVQDSAVFEYFAYPNTFNSTENIFGDSPPTATCFGKRNKNLLKTLKQLNFGNIDFSYTLDSLGLATQYQVIMNGTTGTSVYIIKDIDYECL